MDRISTAREIMGIARSLLADDTAVIVYDYLMEGSKRDVDNLRKRIDDFESELDDIRKQLVGLDKLGSGKIEAQSFLPKLRKALAPLQTLLDNIDQNAKRFSR